ncbi:MAG: thiamine pyrophosphate-dependent dehydrogenase E1 component subunit alpha [Planctomycetota bacterium]|nr:thiamine pyrophosphate-dependent dehydrogenase E1 component subunit alpha [Planctomycetota bacterium]
MSAEPPGEKLIELLYWMMLTRGVDDRCEALFKQGRFPGSVFSQDGHEAISVGSSILLEEGDAIAPMHRDLGAYLVRGMSPGRIFAQALGRTGAPSRGRDVNTHGLGDLELRIFGYISHLPQSMGIALGAAFSFLYRGEDRVAMTYFGDGASSEGGCHEALNLAAVLKAPVVFILENNQYAYSTPLERQCTVENLAIRAEGYGIPGVTIDGTVIFMVMETTRVAIDRARAGDGPTLIECKNLRLKGHAVHDPASYVPGELLDEWRERDPISLFQKQLEGRGLLDEKILGELQARIESELDEAVEWAEESPWPEADTLEDGVFSDA